MLENSQPSVKSENVPETAKGTSEEQGGGKEGSKEGEEKIEVTIESLLKLHNINLELPVSCDFCAETFMDLDLFDEHMAKHTECRFFSCQLCTNTYISWGNLVAHRKVCHRSEVISCDSCSQRKYHPNLAPVNFPVGEYPIGCEECQKGFGSIADLYKHYRLHSRHPSQVHVGATNCQLMSRCCGDKPSDRSDKIPSQGSISTTILGDEQTKKTVRKYGCPMCGAQFVNTQLLQAHLSLLRNEATSYPCTHCPIRFCTAHRLTLHKRSTHPEAKVGKSFACPTCGKVLRNRSAYYRHKMIHTGERPYSCDWCPKTFTRKSSLNMHKYSHPVTEDYSCYNCKVSFKEMDELAEHVKKEHNPEKDSMLTCGICMKECQIGDFLTHYAKCHIAREDEAASLRRVNITCAICNKIFSQPTALARHMKLHDPTERPSYKCDECEVDFIGRYQFLTHLRTHFGSDDDLPQKYQEILKEFQESPRYKRTHPKLSFICEYCGREFHKKMNLQLHVRRHTGERPHLCQLCGKSFYTRQQLAIHVRQHTGERPYQCKVCHKTFTGPTTLYMHRKLHKTKKPYQCQTCDREFLWRSAYIGHMRLHTGERPYKCTLCPKSFTLKGKLNLHMKKHVGEHVIHTCGNCGEHFGSLEELNSHESEQSCCSALTFIKGESVSDNYVVLESGIPEDQVYYV